MHQSGAKGRGGFAPLALSAGFTQIPSLDALKGDCFDAGAIRTDEMTA